jgi:hypothetical protein
MLFRGEIKILPNVQQKTALICNCNDPDVAFLQIKKKLILYYLTNISAFSVGTNIPILYVHILHLDTYINTF